MSTTSRKPPPRVSTQPHRLSVLLVDVRHVGGEFPDQAGFDWVLDNLNTHWSLDLCEFVAEGATCRSIRNNFAPATNAVRFSPTRLMHCGSMTCPSTRVG
ncbi:MAG TPA: hypothetical protein VK137_11805 [Planctomycetaceae bacterium]|nr:hypothetical protein [Planctomycetaceae bacterium]